MDTTTPRIRGRVGTTDDGKFGFEISMWTVDGETRIGEPWEFGPFDTEKEAHEEMRKCAKFVADKCQEFKGLKPVDKYFDFKNGGIMRPWAEQ